MELNWKNKHLELRDDGLGGYRWCDPAEPPRDELVYVADVGSHGHPTGTLVVGDALTALGTWSKQPGNLGSVRLAYIDPPFNTGNKFEHYNDALSDAMWLSMLRDRARSLRPLLHPLGSVWVHIDDSQQHRARCVLDEVFGVEAFVATVIWQKRTTRESRSAFSSNHDYIHVYAPAGASKWRPSRNLLANDSRDLRNRDDDPRGPWADAPFSAPGIRPNQQYNIVNPAGEVLRPPRGRSWYATEAVYERLVQENRIWFPRGGAGLPRIKLFPQHLSGLVPFSVWPAEEVGSNDDAKRHQGRLFPDKAPFSTPKPESLLERIIHIATDPGDLVLDFFAGSGTTGATAHKMGRRWMMVERSTETVTEYILPRMQAVAAGSDPGGISSLRSWSGGGSFSVYRTAPIDQRAAPLSQVEDLVRALNP